MDITVYRHVRRTGIADKTVRALATSVLHDHAIDGDISIHFIGDVRMRSLNRRYRGKDRTTDVLSFAAQDAGLPHGARPAGRRDIGDIFISVGQIKRQAKEWDVPYREELVRMITHGILHALGYDHITKRQADRMFGLQESYVKETVFT